ncbi:MAG: hypothetical protein AAF447_17550 [Myxococcota bacterium]
MHLGLIVGSTPFDDLMVRANAPFAQWVNRLRRGLGPVFADRAKSLVLDPGHAGRLIAYHHNNPVRAKVVSSARESDWTSHRAYLGDVPRPPWLDVRLGLALMELPAMSEGRVALDRYVDDRRDERVLPEAWDPDRERRRLRRDRALAVVVHHPRASARGVDFKPQVTRHRWPGNMDELLSAVSDRTGVLVEAMAGPSRLAHVCEARRVAILVGLELGLRLVSVARAVGRTGTGARRLTRGASADTQRVVATLVDELRRPAPGDLEALGGRPEPERRKAG